MKFHKNESEHEEHRLIIQEHGSLKAIIISQLHCLLYEKKSKRDIGLDSTYIYSLLNKVKQNKTKQNKTNRQAKVHER